MIADSQVHIWARHTPQRPWPSERAAFAHGPPEFLASDIIAAMDAALVDRAILVPAMCEGDRNDMALAARQAHPGRFAVMGRVAVMDPGAGQQLDRELEQGMSGIRLTFVNQESSQLTDGSADWIWRFAEERDIPVMAIAPRQLGTLGAIAKAHPGMRLAVDHMGFTPHADAARAAADVEDLLRLAEIPNVSVKASGFGWILEEQHPFPAYLRGARQVLSAFGAERLFWGTDLSRIKCTYRQAVDLFDEQGLFGNAQERAAVMGESLCRWLGWPPV